MNRQTFKKIITTGAFAGLMLFILNLLADNPYTQSVVRRSLNQKINEITNLQIDYNAFKLSAVPLGIDLFGITVTAKDDSVRPLLTASHIKARISISSLFLGTPKVELIEITDLDVSYPPPWTFPGWIKESAKPPKSDDERPFTWPPRIDIPVEHIALRNTHVTLEHSYPVIAPLRPSQFVFSARGLDLDLFIHAVDRIQIEIRSQSTNIVDAGVSLLENGRLDIDGSLIGDEFTFSRLNIDADRIHTTGHLEAVLQVRERMLKPGPMQLAEKFRMPTGLVVNAHLDATGDLSLLGSFLDIPETRGATVAAADFTMTLPFDDPAKTVFRVTGSGKVKDGYLGGIRLHDSSTKIDVDDTRIAFSDIDAVINGKTVATGTGKVMFNKFTDFDFNMQPKGLKLVDLLDTLDVPFDVFNLAIESPNAHVYGRGIPFKLHAEGTTQLSDVSVGQLQPSSRFPKSPVCRLDLHLLVTEQDVDFNNTAGQCFQYPEGPTPSPTVGDTSPPSGSKDASDLRLTGGIMIDKRESIDLSASSDHLSLALASFFAHTSLGGRAMITTRLHGPLAKIAIDNDIKVNGLMIESAEFGDGHISATVAGERLTWKDITLKTPKGFSAQSSGGSLSVDSLLSIDTQFDISGLSKLEVADLLHRLAPDADIGFKIDRLKGTLRGPLTVPGAYTTDLDFRLLDGSVAGMDIFDEFTGRVVADGKTIKTQDTLLSLGGATFAPNLIYEHAVTIDPHKAILASNSLTRLGLHESDNITLTIDTPQQQPTKGAVSDQLMRLPILAPIFSAIKLQGSLGVQGKLTGNWNGLQGNFQGKLGGARWMSAPIAPVSYRGFLDGKKLNMVLSHGGTAMDGRMSFDFSGRNTPFEWYFVLNRFDGRALLPKMFYDDPRNYIYLDAKLHLKGDLADLWNSTGQVDIEDVKAKFVKDLGGAAKAIDLNLDQPVSAVLSRDGWEFKDKKSLLILGKLMRFTATTQGNKPPQRLQLGFDTVIDMELAKFLSNSVESSTGKINVHGELTGSVDKPNFTMTVAELKPSPVAAISWEPLSIGLTDLRPPLKNISFKATLDNGQLIVDRFTADKGAGTVAMSGNINLTGDESIEESNLDISFQDAAIIYPVAVFKSFDTTVSGSLALSGYGVPYRLRGDVNIARARATRDFDIRDEIINAVRRKAIAPQTAVEKPLVNLEINLLADNTISISNRNMQVALSSNLQISGTDALPTVTGQLEVNRGKFAYKRDFKVTRGLVTFDNPIKVDPNLDIIAVSEVSNYRVYIAVTGRASDPKVDFLVDPPNRDDGSPITKVDILVLLSRGSLPDSQRNFNNAESAVSSEALNILVGQFEEPVEKLFDLSGQKVIRQVYLDTHPSPESGVPIPRINLPISFSEVLNLERELGVVVSIDRDKFWRVTSEYSLDESVSVSGSVDKQAGADSTTAQQGASTDAGFDLKFRFAFP